MRTRKKLKIRTASDPTTGRTVRLRRGDTVQAPGARDKDHMLTYEGNGVFGHQTFEGYERVELGNDLPMLLAHRPEKAEVPGVIERLFDEWAEDRPYSYMSNTCEDAATRVAFGGEGFSPQRDDFVERAMTGVAIVGGLWLLAKVLEPRSP